MSGTDGGLAKCTPCDRMYCSGIITFCKECSTGFCDDGCRELNMSKVGDDWICHPCKEEVDTEKPNSQEVKE